MLCSLRRRRCAILASLWFSILRVMTTSACTTQLNLRIISIVVFTCICYLSIGCRSPYCRAISTISWAIAPYRRRGHQPSVHLNPDQPPACGPLHRHLGAEKSRQSGIVCCLLSGLFTLLAVLLQSSPPLAVAALLVGRIFLGVGKVLPPPARPFGDQNRRCDSHFAGDLVERRGDLCRHGGRRSAGVVLNGYFGISGFAAVVILAAAVGLVYARTRQDVSVTAGIRAPFHVVARKIWPLRAGAGAGYRRFWGYRNLYYPLLLRP